MKAFRRTKRLKKGPIWEEKRQFYTIKIPWKQA